MQTRKIPVLPIRNATLFPSNVIPFRVGRTKSMAAVEAAEKSDGLIFLVSQSDPAFDGEPNWDQLYKVGTIGKIEKVRGKSKGEDAAGLQVVIRGVGRGRVLLEKNTATDVGEQPTYLTATIEPVETWIDLDRQTEKALLQSVKDLAIETLQSLPADTSQLIEMVKGIEDLEYLVHLAAANLDVEYKKKQELLELNSIRSRTLKLLDLMKSQRDNLKLQSEIRDRISSKMGKQQREAFLREQIRTIQEELGESSATANGDFDTKIQEAKMPPEVEKIARDEWKRLESIGNQSPESHVIRNYLDLLVALPWDKESQAKIDLERARAQLEKDHYGLDKVKKKILQYLAVLELKKDIKGSILLLVGPPGVGKTSLGHSVAKALGRKFLRISLGGVRDDSEIRGHRRTYVGAMPGRIIQGLKRAQENNPVMILDEIDKLGRSYQGDPAGALLEVLDPEQNSKFMDHYLDVPFDLSKVFFIATANSLDGIPAPLLDRMEIVDLSGYTSAEKLHIAKNHLIPKQLEEHGLTSETLRIQDEALMHVISRYTREAGVRELERVIRSLVRGKAEAVLAMKMASASRFAEQEAVRASAEAAKAAGRAALHEAVQQVKRHGVETEMDVIAPPELTVTREVLEIPEISQSGSGDSSANISADVDVPFLSPTKIQTIEVTVADLDLILGPEKYTQEVIERLPSPGVVTGLAWTPFGGEILFVESTKMPGKGVLTLTGQLGDVMKESAQIALSLVRSRLHTHFAGQFRGFDFEKQDLHIHVPSGAVPKDGPSAGITLFTSIASLYSGKPVSPKTAMTGEVTLRGSVMPVGGIKEKVIAAHRAGVERIIMCKKNERDLRDVPEEVKAAIKFVFVESVDEVLKAALDLESCPPPECKVELPYEKRSDSPSH